MRLAGRFTGKDLRACFPGGLIRVVLALIVLGPAQAEAQQQETSLFQLTGVRGQARIGYLFDDHGSGYGVGDTRATWEEQLSLDAQGFVYHPALLGFSLGGGPLLIQQRLDTGDGSAADNDVLWGGYLGLDFLRIKPYSFSVQLNRSHPTVTTGLAGLYRTEQREQGINGRLEKGVIPLFPLHLDWGFRQYSRLGSGYGTQLDEDVSETTLKAYTGYRRKDRVRLDMRSERRVSLSGSLGLPIYESRTSTKDVRLYNDNYFGDGDKVSLNQQLGLYSQVTQAGIPSDTYNYTGSLGLQLNDNNNLKGSLATSRGDRGDVGASSSKSQALSLTGTPWQGSGWGYNGLVGSSKTADQGFQRELKEGGGGLTYSRTFGRVQIGLSGDARTSKIDQQAPDGYIRVFDEPVILSGTLSADLRNEYVDTTSVRVTNATGSQVFVEGLDYRLIVVGATTSMERYIDGNIQDGETVLVSYQYQTGGTMAYDVQASRLELSARVYERLNFYARYSDMEHELTSGIPVTPLNDRTVIETGGSVTPVKIGRVTLGGDIRLRDQQEDVSPYRSESVSANLQTVLPWSLNMNLSTAYVRQDYELTDEDVDQVSVNFNLSRAIPGYGRLQYNALFSNNIGGSVPRENRRQSLRYSWAYRQIRVDINLVNAEETMGDVRRHDTRITAEITRAF